MQTIITSSKCTIVALALGVFMSTATSVYASPFSDLASALTRLEAVLQAMLPQSAVLGATVTQVSNGEELLDAIAAATGGETIEVLPGNYGVLTINNEYNQINYNSTKRGGAAPENLTSPVTITSADPNNRAVFENITLWHASNWNIEGISFRIKPNAKGVFVVAATNVKILNNDISNGDGADWTADEWLNNRGEAIVIDNRKIPGDSNIEIAYNNIKYVGFGMSIESNGVHAHHNRVNYFSGDAYRGLGNDLLFEHNEAMNTIKVDDNHDDLFQSFTRGTDGRAGTGDWANSVVRYNTFINSTEDHPLRGESQGIGMFDGTFTNWTIENNLLVVDHYHGISLYGAIDSVIQNNVAVDPVLSGTPGPLWISFFNHKDGRPTVNSAIRNNLTNRVILEEGSDVTVANNIEITDMANYDQYFVDFANYNYTIKPGALSFAVGATIDESRLAPEPFADGTPNQPVAEDPVVEDPVTEEPVEEEPVIEDPVEEEEPVVEDPVEEEPVAEEPETGVRVITTENLNVRATPNGEKLGQQRKGSFGTINDTTRTDLAGYSWVYVDFDTAPDGYVADQFISENLSLGGVILDEESKRQLIIQLLRQIQELQTLLNQRLGR